MITIKGLFAKKIQPSYITSHKMITSMIIEIHAKRLTSSLLRPMFALKLNTLGAYTM